MKKEGKEIKIPAIEKGTVIDHIPSRVTFKIIRLVDPQEFENTISLALNLDSKRLGKKGVIKMSNRFLSQEEVNKVAVLAPEATVSIIKNYRVSKKIEAKVPNHIERIVKCSNPNCITNHETVKTSFSLEEGEPLRIRCAYCERTMGRDDIRLN